MEIKLLNDFQTSFLDDPERFTKEQAIIGYFEDIKAEIEKKLPHLIRSNGTMGLTYFEDGKIEWEFKNFNVVEESQLKDIISA